MDNQAHRLINYKGTKAKCRHLKKLTWKGTFAAGVYQSLLTGDVVIFDPSFVSNTCRKVPLQINFLRWRHFELPSRSLIFLRPGHIGSRGGGGVVSWHALYFTICAYGEDKSKMGCREAQSVVYFFPNIISDSTDKNTQRRPCLNQPPNYMYWW